jgi:hypothetical protein
MKDKSPLSRAPERHGDQAVRLRNMVARGRLREPTPEWAACKHLNRCHGADILRAEWLALGLWDPLLSAALRLPKSGRFCEGCPIMRTREVEAA